MEMFFKHGNVVHKVDVEGKDAEYKVTVDDKEYTLKAVELRPGFLHLDSGEGLHKFVVSVNRDERHVFLKGGAYKLLRVDEAGSKDIVEEEGDLLSPITGKVVEVKVAEGDSVEEKQTLMVLEAMKMEYQIKAPYAGTVKELPFKEGDGVEMGALLVEVERKE